VLLTVREVADALKVCRATVYALVDRGQLERIWVGASMRISSASLARFLSAGRQ
jgi:excisionase family DNA binding protein